MAEPRTLTIQGSEIENYNSVLLTGWNYIGYPYQGSINISIALESISDNYNKVYSYNSQLEKWDVYNPYPSIIEPNTIKLITIPVPTAVTPFTPSFAVLNADLMSIAI